MTAAAVGLASLGLVFVVGTDFFPSVDAGLMKLHFRAPTGSRIERDRRAGRRRSRTAIRGIIPAREIETINAMIGIPISYNLAFVQTDNVSAMDAEILIALKPDHAPTAGYMRRIRAMVRHDFPGASVYFQPADIVSQVLNFGLSSPIDLQVESARSRRRATRSRAGCATASPRSPGTADAHIAQVIDYPALKVDVDRQRAAQAGIAAARRGQQPAGVALVERAWWPPSYFLNPHNNVNYFVVVKTPLPRLASVDQVLATPLTAGDAAQQQQRRPRSGGVPEAPAQMLERHRRGRTPAAARSRSTTTPCSG